MTKNINSYYAIFENKTNGKKLIYYPCPKNANTSAKLFFTDISCMKFIKGKVENSLLDNSNLPEKISLLRLDTDWYESSKKELDVLYPLVSVVVG